MQIVGAIVGGLLICLCLFFAIRNIIVIVKEIKNRKHKNEFDKSNDASVNDDIKS